MEDDQDELMQDSEDDSSGTEDQDNIDNEQYADVNQMRNERGFAEGNRYSLTNWNYSRCEFITTKITVMLSSTFLVILLPAYMDSMNIKSDAYNLLFISSTIIVLLITIIIFAGKLIFNRYKDLKITNFPIKPSRLIVLSFLYSVSVMLIIFSMDRKRVLCHLQDPMKGCALVFSLLYYFIFCRKLMGLQRIFATTTIIVGLFITVDYGLCDEFKCRGYDRVHVSDDTGIWSWKTHSTWIIIYIVGLALFSAFFTFLERYLLAQRDIIVVNNMTPSFLTTISRSVAFPTNDSENNQLSLNPTNVEYNDRLSPIHIAWSVHFIGWLVIVLSSWADTIPAIGKGSSISELLNMTSRGIICHIQPHFFQSKEISDCGNTFVFSWLFIGCYILFSLTSIKFLMMSQSAVYTVATISSSLPLVGIWWSLFKLFPLQNGGSVILWSPSLSGELICSLLGLPIVLIGLFLFCKSHFRDCHWLNVTSNYITMPPHLA